MYAASYHVTIQHYHADNGRFIENLFKNDVIAQRQTISYCGVNAHHQNGVAEKRIRDLQDAARTMLLHAKHRWPSAITANLWPYALRHANEVHASSPRLLDQVSPMELFSGVSVQPKLRHFHTFGCPAYTLTNRLQAKQKAPKWEDRARVGVYLGQSSQHATSVGLVLSLTTGMTSPQFHVDYDETFETVRAKNSTLPSSVWQYVAGFSNWPKGTRPSAIATAGGNTPFLSDRPAPQPPPDATETRQRSDTPK